MTCIAIALLLIGCGDSLEQTITQAQIASKHGKNDKALDFANEALESEPNNTDALKIKAISLMNLKRFDQANQTIDAFEKHGGKNKLADELRMKVQNYQLVAIFSKQKYHQDPDKVKEINRLVASIVSLSQKTAKDNTDKSQAVTALMLKYNAYLYDLNLQRDLARSLATKQTLTSDSEQAAAYDQAIKKLTVKIKALYGKQKATLQDALAIEPLDSTVYPIYIRFLVEQKDLNAIRDQAQALVKKDTIPSAVGAIISKYVIYLPHKIIPGKVSLALAKDILGKVKDKKHIDPKIVLAEIALFEGKFDQAKKIISPLMTKIKGQKLQSLNKLMARTLFGLKEYDHAYQYSKKLAAKLKYDFSIQRLHALILIQRGDKTNAKSIFRNILTLTGYKDPLSISELIKILEPDARKIEISKFISANPHSDLSLSLQYNQLRSENDHQGIQELATQIASQKIQNPNIAMTLATCYLYLGETEKAAGVARNTIKKWPSLILGYSKLVEIHLQNKQYDRALTIIEQIEKQLPEQAKMVKSLRSRLLLFKGQVDQANDVLADAIKKSPNDVNLRIQYAKTLKRLQNLQSAVDQAQYALQLEPKNPQAHMLLYQMYITLGKEIQAKKHLELINTDNIPKNKRVAWLAQKKFNLGQISQVKTMCLNEIKSGNPDPSLRLLLAKAYQSEKNHADAVKVINTLLSFSPKNWYYWQKFAEALILYGDYNFAQNEFDKIHTKSNDIYLRITAGQVYYKFQKYNQVVRTLKKLLPKLVKIRHPKALIATQIVADSYARLKEFKKIQGLFTPFVDEHFFEAEALFRNTVYGVTQNGVKKTIEQLQRVLKIDNGKQFALQVATIKYLINLRANDVALKWMKQWHNDKPSNMRYANMLANTYVNQGQIQDAIQVMERCAQADKTNHLAQFNLADLYIKIHQYPQAQEILNTTAKASQILKIQSLFRLGRMYDNIGLRKRAAEIYQSINQGEKSKDPRILFASAQAYASIGEIDKAKVLFQTIPSYAKQFGSAQLALAQIDEHQGKLDKAKERLIKLTQNIQVSDIARKALFQLNYKNADEDALLKTAAQWLNKKNILPRERIYWLGLKLSIELKNKKYDQALAIIDQQLKLFPDAANALSLKMLILASQGKIDLAKSTYDTLSDDNQSKYNYLFHALYKKDINYMTGKLNPVMGYYIWMSRAKTDKAIDSAKQVKHQFLLFTSDMQKEAAYVKPRAQAKKESYQMVLYAMIAKDLQQKHLANLFIDKAVALDSKLLTPSLLKMQIMALTHIPTKPWVDHLIKEFPESAATIAYRAYLLANADQYPQAILMQKKLLTIDTDNEYAMKLLASMYLTAGQTDNAIKQYKTMLILKTPLAIAAMNDWAYLVAEHQPDRLDEALKFAQTAVNKFPQNHTLRDTLGWIQYKKGHYTQALKNLQQALATLKNNPSVQYHIGATYAKLKQNQWAMLHLRKVIADPKADKKEKTDAQKILNNLGR